MDVVTFHILFRLLKERATWSHILEQQRHSIVAWHMDEFVSQTIFIFVLGVTILLSISSLYRSTFQTKLPIQNANTTTNEWWPLVMSMSPNIAHHTRNAYSIPNSRFIETRVWSTISLNFRCVNVMDALALLEVIKNSS